MNISGSQQCRRKHRTKERRKKTYSLALGLPPYHEFWSKTLNLKIFAHRYSSKLHIMTFQQEKLKNINNNNNNNHALQHNLKNNKSVNVEKKKKRWV